MLSENLITRENMDTYLKAIAKQYRKLVKKAMPAEITLVGGASILINYGFRDSTYDIDALIHAASAMKDAINYVTDTMNLPNGWLNEDFKNTKSYTPRLMTYSKPYRQFSNSVTIRTISGEYLVAMKLMAFRQYKHDISDIVGILREHTHADDPLTYERIDTAVRNLYDSWENLPTGAQKMLQDILSHDDLDALYESYTAGESTAKSALITFEEEYPDVLQEYNLDDILSHLMERQQQSTKAE